MAEKIVTKPVEVAPAVRSSGLMRRKVLRRTNVYIAEYILMLVFIGGFLGLLVSLWYSFFNLILTDGHSGRVLAIATAGVLGSLLVVGPAAYWLYSRVTGEESHRPELFKKPSRTVFLTIWLLMAVGSLVSIAISVVSSIVMAVFGLGGDAAELWVGRVIPGIFAAATIGFGIVAIVKHVSRRMVIGAGIVLAALAAILFIANLVMVVVRKDVAETKQQSSSSSCTYREYLDDKCSYDEYMDSLRDSSSSRSRDSSRRPSTSLEDIFAN